MDLRGIFCGLVEDNKDPEKLGRLKVRVPHVYGAVGGSFGAVTTNDIPWALPSGLPAGMSQQSGGADWLPELGDQVVVQFLDAEPEKPVWAWLMQSQQAVQKFPLHSYETGSGGSVGKPKRGAWVRYGHTIEWNTDGLILTTSKGYRLLLTDASETGNDGDITLETEAGQMFELDDSTNDATLNVNNDWNINVQSQILALANSFSLTTLNDEIEMISGSELTMGTNTDLKATVGRDWTMDVIRKTQFNFTDDWTVAGIRNIDLQAAINLTLKSTANTSIEAIGTLGLNSTGVMTIKSAVAMNLDFLQLQLGQGAASPFVRGDELFTYLTTLYTLLLSHTHPGVQGGPSSTGPMAPPPTPPPLGLLSTVITGK